MESANRQRFQIRSTLALTLTNAQPSSKDQFKVFAEEPSPLVASYLNDLKELGYCVCVIPQVLSTSETELLYQRVWHEFIEKAWPNCRFSIRRVTMKNGPFFHFHRLHARPHARLGELKPLPFWTFHTFQENHDLYLSIHLVHRLSRSCKEIADIYLANSALQDGRLKQTGYRINLEWIFVHCPSPTSNGVLELLSWQRVYTFLCLILTTINKPQIQKDIVDMMSLIF